MIAPNWLSVESSRVHPNMAAAELAMVKADHPQAWK